MLGLSIYLTLWRRSRMYDARTGRRARGLRRLLAYALSVSLLLGLVSAGKARADSAEAMRGLSRDLMALADVVGDGSVIAINGEKIHVAVTPTKQSVTETLDRFAEHCEQNPGVFGRAWASLTGSSPSSLEEPKPLRMGTIRTGDDDEGVVVCLVRSEAEPSDLVNALEEFSRTQDLGALGKMRYAYAKRAANGTQVMTAWTDDHFSLRALAPAAAGEDAPGADSVVVPRLPKSQRLLSAEVEGTSYAVRVYAAPGDVAHAIASYDAAMTERGFQVIHDEARPAERGYLRDGLFITLVAEPAESGGVTVSFAELGSNVGAPSPPGRPSR